MRLPRNPVSPIDPAKTYTLPELIDLAETQNPETRNSWEHARAQADTLGIARSELYPTLAATAVAEPVKPAAAAVAEVKPTTV